MKSLILVRYGELGLKGKNKRQFIIRLAENMRASLHDLDGWSVRTTQGRLWVETEDKQAVIRRLTKVFGIYSFSPVVEAEKELSAICDAAYEVLMAALPSGGTFKVETKRADKSYPMLSPDISREVASALFDRLDQRWAADMHTPQRTINIEIRVEGAYVYGEVIPGAGGLPVGCSGKAVLMLSGGIDSPVAGYMALKRGVNIEAVHFYSFPFTGEKSKEKVLDLCQLLAERMPGNIRLHVVHFTEIQKAIRANCREDYTITIMRRIMFRIAERIAHQRGALAIYTGESVGQVASQTLESMVTINNVTQMPVLRPLVGMDKEDIIKIAKDIGSYETSIQPFEDCCTIFLPKFPAIRPRIDESEKQEKALDIEALITEALEKTQLIHIGNHVPTARAKV